ncbi:hypothetical protein PssiTeo3_44790 [Pseudomonas sichuanensis]|nr:hypothetical protein [Pseudomonas sichuanensis]
MPWDDRGGRFNPCLTVGYLARQHSAKVASNRLISAIAPIVELHHLFSSLKTFPRFDDAVYAPQQRRVGAAVSMSLSALGKCTLFKFPLDGLAFDHEQIAPYAYRSICREYFIKENAARSLAAMIDHPDIPLANRRLLVDSAQGQAFGFRHLHRHKLIYDAAISKRKRCRSENQVFCSQPVRCLEAHVEARYSQGSD